jgi:hypothetical protein
MRHSKPLLLERPATIDVDKHSTRHRTLRLVPSRRYCTQWECGAHTQRECGAHTQRECGAHSRSTESSERSAYAPYRICLKSSRRTRALDSGHFARTGVAAT